MCPEAFPGEFWCHPAHSQDMKGFVSVADETLQGEFQDQQNVSSIFTLGDVNEREQQNNIWGLLHLSSSKTKHSGL